MLAQRVVFGVAIVVMIGVLGNQSLEQPGTWSGFAYLVLLYGRNTL
jgi:hypothetical protein